MKKKNIASRILGSFAKSFAWICCSLTVGNLLCASALADGPKIGGGPLIGGPVRYKDYAGTAVIVRVEKTVAADARRGKATEGYEVWFTFKPTRKVTNELGKGYLEQHKEHQLRIGSSELYPGPKFLKKYGIEKGKEFAATLSVIVEGTSTPVILKLDKVDENDTFEAYGK